MQKRTLNLSRGTKNFSKCFNAVFTIVLSSILFTLNPLKAQVTIGASSYTTLKAAFDDINSGVHVGSIAISISGNTTETVSCVLNASGTGSTSYTDISITPTGGATQVISGAITGYLLDLSGATNVTIDGLGTGGNNLTIRNTTTGASGAIRLFNDASNNVIQNLSLEGSATTANNGVVLFGIGTATGNDNNQIKNCQITAAGTNLPLNGVMSLGTATTGIENSENLVQDCGIFNFFNAAASSRGINLGNGSSAWTIKGNRFYQTTTRTFTTTSLSNIAVAIATSTGSGFTIEDNVIGYNSSGGTGTYTISSAGTIAPQVVGISVSAVVGATTSIQNNTVANVSVTCAGATTCFIGISLLGTGNYNVGTVTGNLVGSSSTANSIVGTTLTTGTTAASIAGILSSATGTVVISNNSIGGLTGTGSATASCNVFPLQVSGGTNTITFNTIGSISVANSINASNTTAINQTVVGINVTGTVTTANTVSNNIIANLTQNSTGASSTVRGIAYSGTGKGTIEENHIFNVSGNGTNATQAGGGVAVQGMIITGTAPTGSLVNKNHIHAIRGTNTGAVATTVCGIGYSNPTDGVISKNIIYDITNTSTMQAVSTPSFAAGILLRALLGTNTVIANNMISLGAGQASATEVVGILNSFNTNNCKIYHNSINIEGSANGAFPSFVFLRSSSAATSALATPIDIKNNIFKNTRSGGTANHYVYGNNYPNTSTSVTATGWGANASNYNAISASTIGWWAADKATATAWKSSSANDANSIANISSTFVDPSIADLHLNMGTTATALESGGTTIAAVITDFDGDNRPGPGGSVNGGSTAPDLGADEFDGVPGDLAPPVLSVTPVNSKDCALADRTFMASITDFTGVLTTGPLQPRVYFKKLSATTWYSEQGTLTSGTAQNGTWSFTISHAAMGGVVAGEIIEYFVLAQDDTPTANLSSSPGGAEATDVNTLINSPAIPLKYQIAFANIGGTYQVGSGSAAPFNTLTNAIASFNNACAQGSAVVFELTDNNYSSFETFPLVIQKRSDASSSNTLTLKPASATTVTISNNTGTGTIVCRNSHTTIDGSNNASSTKDLTIINTTGTAPNTLTFLSNGSVNPIVECTLKNTIINHGNRSSTAVLVYDTTQTAGWLSNIVLKNNDVKGAYNGLYILATSGSGTNCEVSDNIINNSGANSMQQAGILLSGLTDVTANNNTIANVNSTSNSCTGIIFNTATRGVISNNNISNIISSNATGFSQGISSSGASNAVFSNNTISSMNGTTGSALRGLSLFTQTDCTISDNNINGMSLTNSTSTTPILGILVDGSNCIIKGNTLANLTSNTIANNRAISTQTGGVRISKNNITNIKNTNTSTTSAGSASGIFTSSGAGILIDNNFVSDIAAAGAAPFINAGSGYGIYLSGATTANVYHNTVALNTAQTTTTGFPAALYISSGITGTGAINVQNNIFANTQSQGGEKYAISSSAANTVLGTIDNNAYFSSGANLGFIGANRATLSDIRTGFGGNIASVVENPIFASTTNLHINTGTTPSRFESGGGVVTINDDIDGDNRPGPTGSLNGGGIASDIGADEFDGVPAPIVLDAKVFLENVNPATGLMDDYIRTIGNFATSDPYSSAPYNATFVHVNNPTVATVTPSVLAVTGNNAIVDWIIVELRTSSLPSSTVVKTKAALLQKDGDIVDTDGVSPLSILAPNDNYMVSLRHRHHVGFTTANTTILSNNAPTTMNFATNSVPLFGVSPQNSLTPTVWTMVGGDANFDGSVDAFDTIEWEFENGLFDDYLVKSDYNMDGSVDAFDSIIWELNNGKFEEIP